MKTDQSNLSQTQILARMAATRAELIADAHASSMIATARRGTQSSEFQRGPIILQSPYAGLIAAALVVSVILGPAHLIKTAARRGLTPWIISTFRKFSER